MDLENLNFEKYWDQGVAIIMDRGPKILLAIIVLLIGLRLIKFAFKMLN
mgnify:CR=1 FL=1